MKLDNELWLFDTDADNFLFAFILMFIISFTFTSIVLF